MRSPPAVRVCLSTFASLLGAFLSWGSCALAALAGFPRVARAQEAPVAPADPGTPAEATPPLPGPGPEGGAPPVVGLLSAVLTALARNPNAVVAEDEVRRAYALLIEARANSLPTLYATGTYTHLDSDRRIAVAPGMPGTQGAIISAQNQVNGNLSLTVPIVVPRSWAQWSHAADAIDVAKASSADVRRTVAIAVARAYLAVVAQKRVIDAA
ncbi:MAG: TolC family protein, partial [Myxococcales bacterium]|nr:TolC family protein [Myxococcales bacterium]